MSRRISSTTVVPIAAAAIATFVFATALALRSRRRNNNSEVDQDSKKPGRDDERRELDEATLVRRCYRHPRSMAEFESEALRRLSPLARVYFGFVCDEGRTAAACREAFASIRLVPRVLRGDLTNVDTTTKLLGQTLDVPILVAPTAAHNLACPEGEIATARGAGQAGAGYCYNWVYASRHHSEVLREPGVKWLQMYIFEEKHLVEKWIRETEGTGEFSAVILTCDHPHLRVQGKTWPAFANLPYPPDDLDRPFFPNQDSEVTIRQAQSDNTDASSWGTNSSRLSWDDVRWVKSITSLPVVAKGILSADDARHALQAGVDAIVVSNHGGRQCDFAPPAIEALPPVVAAVRGRVPVLVDSGVRCSSDIARALCLGATAVLLGRPPLWALACGGSDGLRAMLDVLRSDLEADLRSLGVAAVEELNVSMLWPPDRKRIDETVQVCLGRQNIGAKNGINA